MIGIIIIIYILIAVALFVNTLEFTSNNVVLDVVASAIVGAIWPVYIIVKIFQALD